MLWAVEEIAAPITERLRAHFASGRPTDRPEKPEWLFELALRITRQLAPGTAPLQSALDSHGLGSVYHLPLEFSRAMRTAVQVEAQPKPSQKRLSRRMACYRGLLVVLMLVLGMAGRNWH